MVFFCLFTAAPCPNDRYHRCKERLCPDAMWHLMWTEIELYGIYPQDGELASIYMPRLAALP